MRPTMILVPALVALTGLAATPTVAQVRAGMVEFDANLRFSYSETELRRAGLEVDSSGWSAGIGGHAGYFVTDRIDVGGSAGFSYWDAGGARGNGRSYSIGPAINWHFRTERRVVPLVGLHARWSWSEYRNGGFDSGSDGWGVQVAGGADVFLNEHVAFRVRAVFDHSESEEESESPVGRFGQVAEFDGFAFEVGVAVFLDRRRDG